MARIDTVRFGRGVPATGGPACARDPDLLDVLASGQPPAFATDSRERVVFWNRGAADLLGRHADDVLGKHCWEVIAGRDVFGNRFCYANCPVAASLRGGECVNGFELSLRANGHGPVLAHVTILRIPSVRPELYTAVHILSVVEESSRLARVLERLGAAAETVVPVALPAEAPPSVGGPPPLTAREREVLQWVAAGLQNKQIAQTLDLSLATVRNHIHNILEKLGVHSKLEAVSLAFRTGWVSKQPTLSAE